MTEKIRSKPIYYSFILTLLLMVLYAAFAFIVQGLFQQLSYLKLLVGSMANIVVTILAVLLLGTINHTNGFKLLFKTKGLAKGLYVLIPVVPFILLGVFVNATGRTSTGMENFWAIPLVGFLAMTSAFMQTALFRGLLATALLVKFSSTEKERVKSVFKASAMFFIIYIMFHVLSGDTVGLVQLVNTFIIGAGFCAAYLYSKNLLCLALFRGAWQMLDSVVDLFVIEGYRQISPLLLFIWTVILVSVVVFTIRYSKRAEPFSCSAK